jgi:hypothetical protein
MRNGFLLLLLVICAGCSHDPQFEPTDCRWGGDLVTPEQAAARRAAADAWKAQQERLINTSNPK